MTEGARVTLLFDLKGQGAAEQGKLFRVLSCNRPFYSCMIIALAFEQKPICLDWTCVCKLVWKLVWKFVWSFGWMFDRKVVWKLIYYICQEVCPDVCLDVCPKVCQEVCSEVCPDDCLKVCLKGLCHGYCACLHLTDANDVNKAMFIWARHAKSRLALRNLHRDSLLSLEPFTEMSLSSEQGRSFAVCIRVLI